MDEQAVYDNPLVQRYASREMTRLWSAQRKFSTWRQLWVALAEAQHELGLAADDGVTPRINAAQVSQLRTHVDDIDFNRAEELERRFRHDVMAHIHTYAEACPDARDIIHLGATSCYVTDNADLILIREALRLTRDRLVGVIDELAEFALRYKNLPTVGFTHFQPAQLTTVGKRACLWAYDFVLDLEDVEHRLGGLRFRGAKGTTGTQASFLALFRGDHEKVRELDELVARKMGFDAVYPVTGQTYSRKTDSQVIDTLSGIGQSAHKFGTDLRLLAHRQEIEESFEPDQVGSSAMAYKRNPMKAERMCSLARFGMSLVSGAQQTAATQWLERTLDDSAIRRLILPQAFLAADAVLRLALNLAHGLLVNTEVITSGVNLLLPYMATENILMAAVAQGSDRQEVHECIRRHSHDVTANLKARAGSNDLVERLRRDPLLSGVAFDRIIDVNAFIGRAPQQVDEFVKEQIIPIRERYGAHLNQTVEVDL
jgi:adenylosuccinate lyase